MGSNPIGPKKDLNPFGFESYRIKSQESDSFLFWKKGLKVYLSHIKVGEIMKKQLTLMAGVFLLLLPLVNSVELMPHTVVPSGVIVAVPPIAGEKSPVLEVITIIHYKEGFGKPPWAGGGKGEVKCYGFISKGAKLINTEDFYINPTNSGLSGSEVLNSISTSAETWDSQTSEELFGTYTQDGSADFDSPYYPDGKNEVSFGDYTTEGVIAVTRIWGYFSGSPSQRYINQFDIMFDTDYTWGSCSGIETTCFDNKIMDLKNIATHEIGHGAGLADVYETSCSEVTMYGYSTYGETKKITLAPQDIAGLQEMYGL